jgi:hypothetical protein
MLALFFMPVPQFYSLKQNFGYAERGSFGEKITVLLLWNFRIAK